MEPLETAEIGSTGLRVTGVGLGGAALGGLYSDVPEEKAIDTVVRALDLGVSYLDTAPQYGHGKSERFLGRALAGVERTRYTISTEVGRVLVPVSQPREGSAFANLPPLEPVFNYSKGGVLRSLEESLERLGLERVDIALIHDPDEGESVVRVTFGEPVHYRQALDEAWPTLEQLRSRGAVKAIGAGMNQWQALASFVRDTDLDCVLLAGRYTLLDQSALAELLPLCERRGVSVILGGPYNSGILASDLSPEATYFYSKVPPDVLERARSIKAVCDRHGVPLKAAALQFVLSHPAVVATIPGARSPAEVEENLEMARVSIPRDLWDELRAEGHIPEQAPTPAP